MGLRFQKRIRLFKGVTLNLSKTGASVSLGGRGARVNFRGDKPLSWLQTPMGALEALQAIDRLL